MSYDSNTGTLTNEQRFHKAYTAYSAPQRIKSWFTNSTSLINNITDKIKNKTDGYSSDGYALDEDTKKQVSSLLTSAPQIKEFMDYIDTDEDNKKKDLDSIDQISGYLKSISDETYGANTYNYNNQPKTLYQLKSMQNQAQTDITNHLMPNGKYSGTLNPISTKIPLPIGTDPVENAKFAQANETYKNASFTLDKINQYLKEQQDKATQDGYNALTKNPDFEKNSQYVSTIGKKTDGGKDVEYEYINNVNNYRENYNNWLIKNGGYFNPEQASGYDYITNDEVKLYNYIRKNNGNDAAHKYVNSLGLTKRMTEADENDFNNFASKGTGNAIVASIDSVLMKPLDTIGYFTNLGSNLVGKEIDPYAVWNLSTNLSSSVRNKISKNMSDVGKYLYNAGMGAADMGFSTLITGGNSTAGGILMGAESANSSLIDSKMRGLSDNQAVAIGTVDGMVQAALSTLKIGTLLDKTSLGKNLGGYIIKNALLPAGMNAGADAVHLFTDILISQDKSEWQKSINDYMENGDDEKTAFRKAVINQAIKMGYNAGQGAITGLTLGGIVAGFNRHGTARVGKEIQSSGGTNDLVQKGLSAENDSKFHEMANEFAKKMESGKNISNYKIGKLAREEYAYSQSRKGIADTASAEPDLTESNVRAKQAQTEASQIDLETDPVKLAAWEAAGNRMAENGEPPTMLKAAERLAGGGDEVPRPVKTAKHALATLNGEKVSVGQVVSTAGGKAVVAIDGGGTAELDSLTFMNPEIAKVYDAAATHGTNAARALVEGYDGSIPSKDYVKAANQYIQAGRARLSKERVAKGAYGSMIDSEVTRESLFLAGKWDAAKVRVQPGIAESTELQATATLTPTPEAEPVPASVPESSAPESSPNPPETVENGVDPRRENGYDGGNEGAGNTLAGGTASTKKIDYKKVFFEQNPDLKGQVVVHHGVEQQVLTRPETKGLFTPEEINAYDNLRGIPNEVNSDVHLSKIRKEWNKFYKENPNPTKDQLIKKRFEIDQKYGDQFNPPINK